MNLMLLVVSVLAVVLVVLAILILMALAATILTESMSNAATVAVLLPVGYSICLQSNIDPVVMTLAVTIPAGMPFSMPISSPPHAIAFSSGYYKVTEAAKPGMIMNLIALVVFIALMMVYWPLIGLNI